MDELMQALFDHITDHLLEKYYSQTAFAERCVIRDEIGRKLWEQLPSGQRDQLEAMFLASFDQLKSLALSHSA